jgi:hypothetical protein
MIISPNLCRIFLFHVGDDVIEIGEQRKENRYVGLVKIMMTRQQWKIAGV